jgi:hypothetical protein
MACFNRNTQEYKDLLGAFSSNMQVDGIITSWQNVNNSEAFPTVGQAKKFLKDKKIAFILQQRNFAEAILGNLSNKKLISKLGDSYYVNNSNRQSRVFDAQVLQSNLNEVKRYLDINNIPEEAVNFELTAKSFRISINENIFTPKDIIQSSRGWDETRSRHIVVHLMRMFPNVKVDLVSVAQAQAYYDGLPAFQKANMPFAKVKSYFDPVAGQVVLIKGRVTDETAIEEMLHPFTDALFIDNPALFNALLNEAKIMFPVLKQQIDEAYTNKRGFDQRHRDLELVTQALTRHFKKEYEENPTKTFKERIKEFLEWFAGIINNLHKYITGISIPFLRSSEIVQSTQQQSSVKPGVAELFESNPELANQVYEVLGFTNKFKVSLGKELEYNDPYAKNRIKDFKKYEVLNENGTSIGTVVIEFRGKTTVILHPELSTVGKGYGKELYKAISSNLNVTIQEWNEGNISKSDSAKNMWDSLEKEGSAVRIFDEEQGDNFRQLTYNRKITPQQKQQAQQKFQEYVNTTGKQDIEGFKEFVTENQASAEVTTINLQDIKPTATLSDIAKLLNTSDIRFDATARADAKIRFSLTPELQSTVDYALRQSNDIQKVVIKKLFHQAQEVKEEVSSLSAGEGGPIVILNEENHVYYNLLDTTETFKSTTERIKGKLSEEDLFNKKLNIDLGNDFDRLLQGLTSDKTLDKVFPQMKILSREQAEKAYLQLQENLKEITRGGGVAIPQVVVYDLATRTAGSIDILVVLPNGKLRIVDLKTSKNSVRDMALSQKAKAKAGLGGQLKYDVEYELGDDSDLKKAGINQLSTRAQQAIQVNLYRRMLENMGYEVDMSEMGASTFHVQVGIEGKDAQQKFTGEFRSDEWVSHPVSQNSLYVDLLVPKNIDSDAVEDLDKSIDDAVDKAVDWDSELKDDEKIPEDTEFSDPYIEYEVITQALTNYRLALITKLKAIDQIKSSIYMDRTKEQTEENILNALSAISMAMAEGSNSSSALFTELLRDALKQIQSFTDYINDPNNFSKPEYITYVLNFNRFIKTFEGLYSVKDLTGINATQKSLILRLQTQLNSLVVSNSTQDSIIDNAITNYVKTQIKNWSSRDDLTDDVLNDLMKHARDIGDMELSTGDLSTSRDTILAVMDKIYKVKKQELLDRVETRNRVIAGLASRLQKLSPNKNTQDLYDFMLEFDDDGEFTGRYVQRLGKQYYKKQQDLRDKLYDENGNPLEYRDVSDAATAKKEDLEFNINLAKLKAAYAAFWSAERLTLDDKLVDGEFHKYTDEFKAIRAKHQYYVSVNGKPIWRRKAGVSDRAYQVYLAKYFNQVEYTYAKKDQNDNFTGAIVRESVFNAVKPQYRVANDYNLRTGERMISDKYEKIMNPTDALGQVQKEFFLAYQEIYENELLKKLPMGYRSQMLGKAPIVKGKLFQDVKNKPNIVGKLWSKATRSINNLISETAEQRGVVIDENGNLVDQLPIFYTGRVRTDAELEAVNNEINALEESKKKGLIKQDDYNREIAILKGRRLTIQARPSKGELSKDMGASLMQFSAMAEHYEVMSTVEDTFKAFIKVLEQRRYQPSDPLITLGTWSKNMFTPKAAKTVLEANVVKRAKKWMAMVYYDNERVTKGFLEKVTDGLITYSSLSYVAFNPFGNFNNYALGRINNSIEALGGRFFSGSAYSRAEFEFNKRALPDLIVRLGAVAKKPFNKSDYDPEEPSSKYEALVDLFRMMDNKSEQRENQFGPEPIGKSWFRKATDFGYVLQDAAEYNVQTKVGMAILMDTMIMNKSTGDILSLYDAFEFNSQTKKASLKDGYDTIVTLDKKNIDKDGNSKIIKELSYNDDFRYELRNKIREVNKQIHGNYAKDDRMVIESYTLGRLAAQFHKWVAPAIKARFRREYFDENLGWLEGRYRSFWKFLAYTGKQLTSLQLEFGKHQENFLVEYGYTGDGSQQDQRAKDKLFGAYRTLGEIGIIMITFAISSIFSAMFSDDDDDTEFESRMENFLRYQADRTYKELILFTPLGSQQVYQMFKSPIAATRTLGEFGEALSLSVTTPLAYLIKGEEEFYLDKDYVYQRGIRKGELKLYKNWEDVIPILYSIKKWQDFNNLTNFYIK